MEIVGALWPDSNAVVKNQNGDPFTQISGSNTYIVPFLRYDQWNNYNQLQEGDDVIYQTVQFYVHAQDGTKSTDSSGNVSYNKVTTTEMRGEAFYVPQERALSMMNFPGRYYDCFRQSRSSAAPMTLQLRLDTSHSLVSAIQAACLTKSRRLQPPRSTDRV